MNTEFADVIRLEDFDQNAIGALLRYYGLQLEQVAPGQPIPGSYWGGEEAGLRGNRLITRPDTPVHSVLHEACHYVCMDASRRETLDTDASGDYDEENAVCYLQVLLADQLPGLGRARIFRDMDTWGYSFRLGSARKWFEQDADDARFWLLQHELITADGRPSYGLRER